jgi:hypothetical protein
MPGAISTNQRKLFELKRALDRQSAAGKGLSHGKHGFEPTRPSRACFLFSRFEGLVPVP